MLHNSLLIDMACRASNLSERTLIVKNLVARNAREACTTPLSPLDTWNINKLAGKLAVQPVKESYEEGSVNTSILEDIKKTIN